MVSFIGELAKDALSQGVGPLAQFSAVNTPKGFRRLRFQSGGLVTRTLGEQRGGAKFK